MAPSRRALTALLPVLTACGGAEPSAPKAAGPAPTAAAEGVQVAPLPAPSAHPLADLPRPRPAPPGPHLRFAATRADYGVLHDGDVRPLRFWFRSEGGAAATIRRLRHTCGCTSHRLLVIRDGHWQSFELGSPLAPGELGAIEVIFDTHHQAGTRVVQLRLESDATATTLELSGEVRPSFTVAPAALDLGTLRPGQEASAEVTVASDPPHPFVLRGVARPWPFLEVEALAPGAATEQRLRVTLSGAMPAGPFEDTLLLELLREGEERARLAALVVRARREGALEVVPPSLSLGTLAAGRDASAEVLLRHHGGPLEVREVVLTCGRREHVAAEILPGDDAASARVRLKVAAGCPPGPLSGLLQITTSVPDEAPVRVPFAGFVETPDS